jgi:hypothetical protein
MLRHEQATKMDLTRNTVYALTPKRTRRQKAKAAPVLVSHIVDNRSKPTKPEPDLKIGRSAQARMWREMVEAA